MKITVNKLKKTAIALIVIPTISVILFGSAQPRVSAAADDFDAAAMFKAKCAMCHGADASKKFDATKADDVLVGTVLKGRDAAPIKMPAYGEKGVTEEQAKALVAHMKSLKK